MLINANHTRGSGNDDLLIGAPYSSEGGSYAGQAYLVLGGAGLATDTDLGSVDASWVARTCCPTSSSSAPESSAAARPLNSPKKDLKR